MSAVLEAQEPSALYLTTVEPALIEHFELLAQSSMGIRHIRELVLAFALEGKLVPQDPRDEPAEFLLRRVRDHKVTKFAGGNRKAVSPQGASKQDVPYPAPHGWVWTSLADIGLINPRNEASDDMMASFVQMSSIPTALSDAHVTEAKRWKDIKSGFTQFAEGDVGVAKITPCFENGKSTVFQRLANGIGAGTTELHIVRPLCGIDPRYVLIFLKSPRFLRNGEAVMTDTAGQKRLPRSYFENCPFPLPPLAEQARIVARVDELMGLCDALAAKGRLEAEQHGRLLGTLLGTLTNSTTPEEVAVNWQRVASHFDLLIDRPEAVDALEKSIVELAVRGLLVQQDPGAESADALWSRVQRRKHRRKIEAADLELCSEVSYQLPTGWRWASIDELSADTESAITDGPFGANLKTEHYIGSEGHRVIRLQNIGFGSFRDEHRAYITKEHFERLRRHEVGAGDVVVAGLVDEAIRCCVVPDSIGPAIVKADCYRFAVHPELSAAFVCLYLGSEIAHEFASVHHHGLTLTRIGLGNFRRIPVALPPANEQVRIVARVTELRRLCTDLRQRLAFQRTVQSNLADALVEQALA